MDDVPAGAFSECGSNEGASVRLTVRFTAPADPPVGAPVEKGRAPAGAADVGRWGARAPRPATAKPRTISIAGSLRPERVGAGGRLGTLIQDGRSTGERLIT